MIRSILAFSGLLFVLGLAKAQTTSIEQVLQMIEANNQSLKAFQSYKESKVLEYKTTNNLPDPQASAYYLPFGEHASGDYSEFEISQRIEFPTVYSARNAWISSQEEQLSSNYKKLRKEILLEAKKLVFEHIYLNQKEQLFKNRVEQSGKVFEQIQTLFDKGQAGVLDLNKAKIVWLDQQFSLEKIETDRLRVEQKLQQLNGGKEIELTLNSYPEGSALLPADSLWTERIQKDEDIVAFDRKREVVALKMKVEKNQLLPDITAGFNYQGVAGNNYSGFYGGLSIPLWNGRNRVNMVEAEIDYLDAQKNALISEIKSNFHINYQHFLALQHKVSQYKKAFQELNSESLLLKSYELGEISFQEYYGEVSFYRDTENRMLEMEKELQQLKAELLQHQL